MEFWHFHLNWRLIKTDTNNLALTRKHQVVAFKGSWPKVELTAKRKELAQRNKTYIVKLWLWNTWFGFFRILETRKKIQKKPQYMHTLTPINLPFYFPRKIQFMMFYMDIANVCNFRAYQLMCFFRKNGHVQLLLISHI